MIEGSTLGGRFELLELIDQGGMGSVYRARSVDTGETVAVKALKPDVIAHDPALIDRFKREGEALRQLNHPHIVKIIDTVEQNEQHFIIMEYVPGGSLDKLMRREERLSVQQTLEIALDIADALSRAHRLKIIHRDIKPANVLLATDGTPRLTDFGVAQVGDERTRLTEVGAFVGTIAYISPEVARGAPYDEKSDIWSFGVMLYEMLTGVNPFAQSNVAATLTAILNYVPPDITDTRPDVPPELAYLIDRMIAKDPDDRLNSARFVGAELEAILSKVKPSKKQTTTTETPVGVTAASVDTPTANTPLVPTTAQPDSTPITLTPRPVSTREQPPTQEVFARRHVTNPRIFVAYRREDSGETARAIYELLNRDLGDTDVAADVDKVANRTINRLVLAQDIVESFDAMLVVIGQQWIGLNKISGSGKPQTLFNPKDPVRIQVEAGLKRPDMLIIPVLVDGAQLPPASELPPSLQKITTLTPYRLDWKPEQGEDALEPHVRKLIKLVRTHFNPNNRRWLFPALVVAAILIALLIMALIFSANATSASSVEPVAPGEIMVLMVEPEALTDQRRDVTRFIVDDLTQVFEQGRGVSIRVRTLPQPIRSAEEARVTAELYDASVIVWGNYNRDFVELNIQVGDLTLYPNSNIDRRELERVANIRVHMTDERRQSIAMAVIGVLLTLQSADGDVFDYAVMLNLATRIVKPSPPAADDLAAERIYLAFSSLAGDPVLSRVMFDDAIAVNGGSPILYLFRALTAIRAGDLDAARLDAETARRLANTGWAVPQTLIALIAIIENDFIGARSTLDAVLTTMPDDSTALTLRGMLNYFLSDRQAAQADLERAITLAPQERLAYPMATLIAMHDGRFDTAGTYLFAMMGEYPDVQIVSSTFALLGVSETLKIGDYFAAASNLVIGQYQAALDEIEQFLSVSSDFSDAYMIRGFSYCALGDLDRAEADFATGHTLDPDHRLINLLRALVEFQRGNAAGAVAILDEARIGALSAAEGGASSELIGRVVSGLLAGEVTCANVMPLLIDTYIELEVPQS